MTAVSVFGHKFYIFFMISQELLIVIIFNFIFFIVHMYEFTRAPNGNSVSWGSKGLPWG